MSTKAANLRATLKYQAKMLAQGRCKICGSPEQGVNGGQLCPSCRAKHSKRKGD